MTNGNFGGGNGTELNPYLIEDAADLNQVRDDLTACYKQTKNIDLSKIANWMPLNNFSGTFDGSNFSIENLNVSTSGSLGLFGRCSGKLININIKNANINGGNFQELGILAGELIDAEVANCIVQGKVHALGYFNNVGGLAGAIAGTSIVKRCAVINSEIKGKLVGGFVGNMTGQTIENCYVTGNVIGYTTDNSISQASGFAENFYNGEIINCYAAVNLSFEHKNEYASKLSPFSNKQGGVVKSCYSDVDTKGVERWGTSWIYRSGAIVKGTDDWLYVCTQTQENVDYDASYPFPPMTKAEPTSGDVWGQYWKLSESVEYKTTDEMKTKSTFIDWDFDTIWTIEEGKSYPTFKKKRAIITCKRVPLTNYRR